MKALFSPAIALMNRLGYTRKFSLLALVSTAAFAMVTYSLYNSLYDDINIAQRELEGIALVRPISKAVQAIQLHRGIWVLHSSGNGSMWGSYAAREGEAATAFDVMKEKLPASLKETEDWRNIEADWKHLEKEEANMTAADNFAAHTRLIGQLLFFQVAVADQFALTLDPQIDTYYLIDTAVGKLPAALEHIGQLRVYGVGILSGKQQLTEKQKITLYKIIGVLDDALAALKVNLEKTGRYNQALQNSLSTTSGNIADSVRQIVSIIELDILTSRFAISPEDYFVMTTSAIENSYRQLHELLLPTAEALLKARIARAEKILRVSIGAALLLLLVMTYFAIGIYYSIIGNVQSLARSARAFTDGNLHERIHLGTRDEIGQIGESFNEMAESFNVMLEARRQQEESEAMLRAILEMSPDYISMANPDGYISYINRAGRKMLGIDADEELGYRFPKVHPQWATDLIIKQGIPTAVANGVWQGETALLSRDGCEISVSQVILAHKDKSGEVEFFSTIMRNISLIKQREEELRQSNTGLQELNRQLKEAQDHLMQAEKMSSIGQLAAGVAHEINNPIGYVYSNLGTLEKYMQDTITMVEMYEYVEKLMTDDVARARLRAAREKLDIAFLKEDLRALMSESKDGITRVKNIVQNLKDFSHVDASDEWHFADLHKGLDSTLNIVNNEIKYKANVVREYGNLPEVECLSSQLNQVFMNLLVNAAHAIEERGTITIRTGQRGDEVWVEVADTGKGIAPEHIKKIFDPFFTTKPIGKGTGLGLSLSYGIIQKHHGRIEVQSEVGKGTTFRVWLPVKQTRDDA